MRRLLLLSLLAFAAAGAHAQPCTTLWINPTGGVWTTGANWDAGVPDAADHACVTLDGTYTVTLSTGTTVDRLTLGGASGTQTLAKRPAARLR